MVIRASYALKPFRLTATAPRRHDSLAYKTYTLGVTTAYDPTPEE